jgi:hypothetical protein
MVLRDDGFDGDIDGAIFILLWSRLRIFDPAKAILKPAMA